MHGRSPIFVGACTGCPPEVYAYGHTAGPLQEKQINRQPISKL